MNKEEEIRNFVALFREKIESKWTPDLLWEHFIPSGGDTPSAGYCGPSSVLVINELKKAFPEENFSIATGRVYSNSKEWIRGKHVWVVWHHNLKTATIIDVTADQSRNIDEKIIFENIDNLAHKGINYIAYRLQRSIEDVDDSSRKRAEILEKMLAV